MGRIADPKAVVGKGEVFLFVSSDVDVAVVEAVVRQVPVAFLSSAYSQFYKFCSVCPHVLSKPTSWVKICSVGCSGGSLLGMQN